MQYLKFKFINSEFTLKHSISIQFNDKFVPSLSQYPIKFTNSFPRCMLFETLLQRCERQNTYSKLSYVYDMLWKHMAYTWHVIFLLCYKTFQHILKKYLESLPLISIFSYTYQNMCLLYVRIFLLEGISVIANSNMHIAFSNLRIVLGNLNKNVFKYIYNLKLFSFNQWEKAIKVYSE